ncbi:MerR family transcriptional regulator [Gottfriedia acidiceleris]|uniref:MerR family transcriptional regulator n=1 Tax=Gottfriedia acidiceleris TaxID=371036 RepID=UPI0030000D13
MIEWITITELAERTNIPEPTVRRYLKLFKTFFKDNGGSRSKRYEEQGVKILVRIKNLYDSGRDTEEISGILTTEFSMIIDDNSKNDSNSNVQTLPTAQDMDEIRRSIKFVEETLEQQKEHNKKQEEFNKVLVEKLDQRLMEQIRLIQEMKQAQIEAAPTVEEKKPGRLKQIWNIIIGK